MKKNIVIVILSALALMTFAQYAGGWMTKEEYVSDPTPRLNHQQEVWLNVLEWCESRGKPESVNPNDLDGTLSYGAFQFKPSTLDYFAEKYGIATTTLMNYDTQRAVVKQMILHRDEINWHQQFPDCVKKYGLPPAK